MPYIRIELDGIGKAARAAGVAGIGQQHAIGGLVLLWEWCWREKTDRVSPTQLAGLFAFDGRRVADGLEAFGFVERLGTDIYRVRGVKQYLAITESRIEGAKLTNEKRWGGVAPGRSKSDVERSLPVALTANSQQPTANSQKEEEELSDSPTELIQVGQEPPGASPAQLQALWNATADRGLPRWTAGRLAAARVRLRDRDLASWAEVIAKINASPFCLGDNPRGWRANPDWLLRPETALKVLEGQYDRTTPGQPNKSKPAAGKERPKYLWEDGTESTYPSSGKFAETEHAKWLAAHGAAK